MFAGASSAQNPTLKTRPKDELDHEYLASHRITVNVQVMDSTGRHVTDLGTSEFALFDNNQPRKIASVRLIDGEAMSDATEVLIVLDAVNSTAQDLQRERDAIFNYLAHGHGPLPYPTGFGLWFNGHMKVASATTDRNALGKAFVSLTKGMHSNACEASELKEAAVTGKSALKRVAEGGSSDDFANCQKVHFRDSLSALDGLAQQQKSIGGRTILIWLGQGWPSFPDIAVGHLSEKIRSALFENVVDLMRDFRDAQMTIDVIAPVGNAREKDRTPWNRLPLGTESAQNVTPENLALPVLAAQTGGRALTESNDLGADLVTCIRDADSYYALTFQQMRTISSHELHKVAVKVTRPGLDERALSVYYAEP
jgi:VWFA-related protein